MTTLDELLGIDPENDMVRRAEALHNSNADMLAELISLRKKRGWSQEKIASLMGVTQPTVAAFEHYDNDPKLSTIERYANAVEALVLHQVEDDRDGRALNRGWKRRAVQPKTIELDAIHLTAKDAWSTPFRAARSSRRHFALAA